MSWKKYFTPVQSASHYATSSAIHKTPGPARSNYSSYLPDVYAGAPNRVDRYLQYDVMDNDPEVNAALDIIAEFCTQKDNENRTPFNVFYRGTPTSAEVKLIKDCLQKWCKLQRFENRIFRIFRNTLKHGDCIFLRDPETKKWLYVDPTKITKIIANESIGKIPSQYCIKDINFNFLNLVATTPHGVNNTVGTGNTSYTTSGTLARGMVGATSQPPGTRFQAAIGEIFVNAENVVHISLSEGMDANYPFGNSILESVFKVYKQKELLEDAIIIYRVQRAPERRIFYIDVGNMPAHMAMSFVERVKTEMQQRRIPSTSGTGMSVVDSSYSPIAQNEDFWLPQGSDGRGSKIETLPGGCFAMDTKISLLDGRELSIREIEVELKSGKELWTYSCQPITGKVEPGLISWAGVTQKSAKVMKLTLDNGEEIICTPDHKFPVYEQEFKRANEFIIGDSLIPLYRQKTDLETKRRNYEQFFDNFDKTWKYTHRTVANYFKDTLVPYYIYNENYSNGAYDVRHHKNFNRFDNSPSNLCWMSFHDHRKYHTEYHKERILWLKENNIEEYRRQIETNKLAVKNAFNKMTDDEYQLFLQNCNYKSNITRANKTDEEKENSRKKMSNSAKAYINSLSVDERNARNNICAINWKIGRDKKQELLKSAEYRELLSKRLCSAWLSRDKTEHSKKIKQNRWENRDNTDYFEKNKENHEKYQKVKYSHAMLKEVIRLVRGKTSHQVSLNDVIHELNNNNELLTELSELNKFNKTSNWCIADGFTYSGIITMIKSFGYYNWHDFRVKESVHNHTIVKIEYLEDEIEVGTLTIDQDEKYHNYHTFALSSGIFAYNSNLDSISDLRFFTNKMFRALRIPAAYLPTGLEEASNTVADGKVGTAYIQELRFNEYCKRLQNMIVETFDLEFKLWLYDQGINIDTTLYQLKFNEPQNFASYRQAELDSTRVGIFTQLQEIPYLSKRFAMKRFLGMTQEEITENETMWKEENYEKIKSENTASELRSAGVTPGGMAADMSGFDQELPDQGIDGGNNTDSAPVPDAGAAPAPTPG